MSPEALLEVAVEAARAAGVLLAAKFEAQRTIENKGPGRIDLVTDADRASEAVILEVLARRCPGHVVVAEESGLRAGAGAFTWYVDPLDGTTNYAHQVPHFCVTLAVEGPVADGSRRLLAGVVFDPLRGECFTASRGGGAFLNGRRLTASGAVGLERALVCTGFPYDVQERPELPLGLFARVLRRVQGVRRMGSAALDLAFVAAGRFDGFFEFGLKPWDTAAGALLVEEAGGAMLRLDGAPYEVLVGDVLAVAPGVAQALSAECREFVREKGWVPRQYAVSPSPASTG